MSETQTDHMSHIDLDTLYEKTVQELRVVAKELNIKRSTGIRKQTLIDRIREAAAEEKRFGDLDNGVRRQEITPTQYGSQSHIQTYEPETPSRNEGRRPSRGGKPRDQYKKKARHVSKIGRAHV